MASAVQIVNLALDACGSRAQVTSISPSDGSQAGDVASRQYMPRLEALSRSAHWGCLRSQATLSVVQAATGTPENPDGTLLQQAPQPWLYAYALPPDCLKARFIVPLIQPAASVVPALTNVGLQFIPGQQKVAIPFVIATVNDTQGNRIKVLLSNWPQAQLVYTALIQNPDLWDSLFTTAFVATLAAFFVNPLNRNAELAKDQILIAKAQIDTARAADGNEGPTSTDHTPDWIAARGGGGYGAASTFWMPWDRMAFPEGGPY